jgi:hypothetical protein
MQVTDVIWFVSPVELPPGCGIETASHLLPFQCRDSFSCGPLDAVSAAMPTAKQLEAEVQATPLSMWEYPCGAPPGFGVATSLQCAPFQWRAWLTTAPPNVRNPPTAQQLEAEVQVT